MGSSVHFLLYPLTEALLHKGGGIIKKSREQCTGQFSLYREIFRKLVVFLGDGFQNIRVQL